MITWRNLILYRLGREDRQALTAHRLDEAISRCPLKPPPGLAMASVGFMPLDWYGGAYTFNHQGRVFFKLGIHKRLLPTVIINQELAERINAIRVTENRAVGHKERRKIRDDIYIEFVQRAFITTRAINCVLDLHTGWLWVDATSYETGNTVCSSLREALTSFPARTAATDTSLRACFTAWLHGNDDGKVDSLAIGTDAVLVDGFDDRTTITARNQELFTDEIETHLQAGKLCTKLDFCFDGKVNFTLNNDLRINKIQLIGDQFDELNENVKDDAELNEGYAIATINGIGELVAMLERQFDLQDFE